MVEGTIDRFKKFPKFSIALAYLVLKPSAKDMKTTYADIFIQEVETPCKLTTCCLDASSRSLNSSCVIVFNLTSESSGSALVPQTPSKSSESTLRSPLEETLAGVCNNWFCNFCDLIVFQALGFEDAGADGVMSPNMFRRPGVQPGPMPTASSAATHESSGINSNPIQQHLRNLAGIQGSRGVGAPLVVADHIPKPPLGHPAASYLRAHGFDLPSQLHIAHTYHSSGSAEEFATALSQKGMAIMESEWLWHEIVEGNRRQCI